MVQWLDLLLSCQWQHFPSPQKRLHLLSSVDCGPWMWCRYHLSLIWRLQKVSCAPWSAVYSWCVHCASTPLSHTIHRHHNILQMTTCRAMQWTTVNGHAIRCDVCVVQKLHVPHILFILYVHTTQSSHNYARVFSLTSIRWRSIHTRNMFRSISHSLFLSFSFSFFRSFPLSLSLSRFLVLSPGREKEREMRERILCDPRFIHKRYALV